MKWKFALANLIAVVAGIGYGQLTCQSTSCRDAIGRACGKGHLLALAHSQGIYETDIGRAVTEFWYANGEDGSDLNQTTQSRQFIVSQLATSALAQCLATDEKVPARDIECELRLLQSQFRDRATWTTALRANGLSEWRLRRMIADDLRTRRWIRRQIAPQSEVTTEECRQFYQARPEIYFQPIRFRVSHLFVAAPPETLPETIDAKQQKIESCAKRMSEGENFLDLVASESEDEATKTRGGDLGFFSAYRMPADFFAAAGKVPLGQVSKPVRTFLGFHIIQTTDRKPARQMTFDEASVEIKSTLEREKRRTALRKLDVDLSARIRFVRSFF
jgi:parvulin-like peptidyl-prolyl isomerase